MHIQEIKKDYTKGSKIFSLYLELMKWNIKYHNAWRSKTKKRLSKVCKWKSDRLKAQLFKEHKSAIWILSWSRFGNTLTVTFLINQD